MLLPLGNPIKFHEEVLFSLRRFPPKRFDNFPPCLGDAQKVDMCVVCFLPIHSGHPLDVPAGVTQEEGHTGFLIHLPSAVRALIFVARRIQPFLSLVDREVQFCVLTI